MTVDARILRRLVGAAALTAAAGCFAQPALGLAPPLPCEIEEAGMLIGGLRDLSDGDYFESGVTFESYQVRWAPDAEGVYRPLPGPIPELNAFSGVRVTYCRTGEFLAIADADMERALYGLRATEFLRKSIAAKRPPSFRDLRRAAEAVFGDVLIMRETAETCGCRTLYPDLRPEGVTPYDQRDDIVGAR